ncbi:MAG: amidohydrolase family protein [Verrucomicrobiota bacterium]|nr:amidohydrolase family protein [Verrucomicrobiota bacterium]
MIIRARCVLTMDGAPIENGAVAVRGEKIQDLGEWGDVRARNSGEVVDLGDSILMPGLINAHCHLDYTNLRGQIPPQPSFADWIRDINRKKAEMNEDDYLAAVLAGIDEAAAFGTTTIGNLEAVPELIARVPDDGMRLRWFVEMIALQKRGSAAETLARFGLNLAPHAPYTAPRSLYAETALLTKQHQLVATTHLAESREETEMFRDASGLLYELMKRVGRDMSDCGRKTPIAWMLEDGDVLDDRWVVAHLNEITAHDFELLARAPKFHIVHCPRSHAFFRHSPFAFGKLREVGFNISLGTDSLASNDDLSLFAEMRQFAQMNPAIAAREVVEMVTTHPAAALHEQASLGRIRQNFVADLIAIPFAGNARDAYESVVEFAGKVSWRMLAGNVALPR